MIAGQANVASTDVVLKGVLLNDLKNLDQMVIEEMRIQFARSVKSFWAKVDKQIIRKRLNGKAIKLVYKIAVLDTDCKNGFKKFQKRLWHNNRNSRILY